MEIKEIADKIGAMDTALGEYKSATAADIKKINDALAALEAKQTAGAPEANAGGVSPDVKCMIDYLRTGAMDKKAAVSPSTTTSNPSGGYLAIPDFQARVVEKLREACPLVDIVENIRINGNAAYLPVEVNPPVSTWRAEAASTAQPAAGVELEVANIALQSLRTKVLVSDELLADSNLVGIEQYLVNSCSKQMSKAMGKAILYGRGAQTYNEPNGITTDDKFVTVDSKSSGVISAEDIFDVIGAVPSDALSNAKWVMSNATFMKIAKALGTSEVVQLPISENIKPAIFGYEVVFAEVDNVASGKVPALFGDFYAGYKAVTAGGLTYKRDEYSAADYGQVAVRFWTRIGGQLVDENAIVGLKIKA